jgi:hypothetical protein
MELEGNSMGCLVLTLTTVDKMFPSMIFCRVVIGVLWYSTRTLNNSVTKFHAKK